MTKKKNSAMKKLIPATSMLLVSATMLTASTYAWFTMSKEVEVTGIKLTASVPNNLEISLGAGTKTAKNASFTGLAHTSGLSTDNMGTPADDSDDLTRIVDTTKINTPDHTTNTTDWANTVDFSDHYVVGRLKPASSVDGDFIFMTNDATEQGTAVSKTADFQQATASDMAEMWLRSGTSDEMSNDVQAKFDLLASGYYIDFPVWFRTSATNDALNPKDNTTYKIVTENSTDYLVLGVRATVTQRSASDAEQDLYHAVRIAILDKDGANSAGVITNYNDSVVDYYDRYNTSTAEAAIGDDQALKASGTLAYSPATGKQSNASSLYGLTDKVNQFDDTGTSGETIIKVPLASEANSYGYSDKYIVRVWLEGEDVNCWNETAGQDWNIGLRFIQLDSSNTDVGVSDKSDSTSSPVSTSSISNQAVNVTVGGVQLTYTYDTTANTYKNTSTGNISAEDGAPAKATWNWGNTTTTYKLQDGTKFASESDFVAYLNKYNTVYDFTDITLTAVS